MPRKAVVKRGFAALSKDRRREISAMGGRAAHEKGTAYKFDYAKAVYAACKGHELNKAHKFTPAEARVAGRKGIIAKAANKQKRL